MGWVGRVRLPGSSHFGLSLSHFGAARPLGRMGCVARRRRGLGPLAAKAMPTRPGCLPARLPACLAAWPLGALPGPACALPGCLAAWCPACLRPCLFQVTCLALCPGETRWNSACAASSGRPGPQRAVRVGRRGASSGCPAFVPACLPGRLAACSPGALPACACSCLCPFRLPVSPCFRCRAQRAVGAPGLQYPRQVVRARSTRSPAMDRASGASRSARWTSKRPRSPRMLRLIVTRSARSLACRVQEGLHEV